MTLTVYQRNGGFPAVRGVVSSFYERVLESPVIAHRFENVDMARLIDHQTRFVAFLMGGPASFSDDHLSRVHGPLRINLEEFDEMVELLVETLEDHDYSQDDIAHVSRELRNREPIIVTGR